MSTFDSLPDDIDTLKQLLHVRAVELAQARAEAANAAALIAHQRLTIEKMRRELYGTRSERKMRLLDQLELELDAHSDEVGRGFRAKAAAFSD
jgi:hypothetical protein